MSHGTRTLLAAVAAIVLIAVGAWIFLGLDEGDGGLHERNAKPPQSSPLHEVEDDVTLPLDELEPGETEPVAPDAPSPVAEGPDMPVPEPGLTISGRVVDDATSEPVAGADILPFVIRGYHDRGGKKRPRMKTDGEPTITGEDGGFTVKGVKEGPHRVWARHPQYSECHADCEAGDVDVEIRLCSGFRIFGIVRDIEGEPAVGVGVGYFSSTGYLARYHSCQPPLSA